MSQANPDDAALGGPVYFAVSTGRPGVAFQHSLVYLAGVMALLAAVSAIPSRRVAAVPA